MTDRTDMLRVVLQQQAANATSSSSASASSVTRLAATVLCVSSEAASVVHQTCRGALHVNVRGRKQRKSKNVARAEALCRWMAKHARLLHTLELVCAPVDEAAVLAGLQAAKGEAMAADAEDKWVQLASKAAAEAAGAGASGSSRGRSLLPLSRLLCCRPAGPKFQTDLMLSLHNSPLTSLKLTLPEGCKGSKSKTKELAAALAVLTGLQRLTLTPAKWEQPPANSDTYQLQEHGVDGVAYVSCLGPALAGLTQLTALNLNGWTLLATSDARHCLPPSLERLKISRRLGRNEHAGIVEAPADPDWAWPHAPDTSTLKAVDLSALTRLTHLTIRQLHARDKLPTSLVVVALQEAYSLHPVLRLTQLECLRLTDTLLLTRSAAGPNLSARSNLEGLDPLVQLSTLQHLTDVQYDSSSMYGTRYGGGEFLPWDGRVLDNYADCLASVAALRQLRLSDYFLAPNTLAHIGSCTGLTTLRLVGCFLATEDDTWGAGELCGADVVTQFNQLARALTRLASLLELHLDLTVVHDPDREEWEPTPVEVTPDVTQPVVDAVCSLTGLSSLTFDMGTVENRDFEPRFDLVSDSQKAQLRALLPGAVLHQ